MFLPPILGTAIVVSFAVLACGVAVLVIAALRCGGRREDAMHPNDASAGSRLTIPVSVITVMTQISRDLSRSIASLQSLTHPQFEIVVVAAGMAEGEIRRLSAEWNLEPKEFFYQRTMATAPVRRIYQNREDTRLMVVQADSCDVGEALNCGVCLARFPYVATVPPGVVLDSDALGRMMAPATNEASVLAVASHVETRGGVRPMEAFQWLRSIRSWLETKVTWNRLQDGLGLRSAVVVWRREALLELGGFPRQAVDAELEMLLRLQTSAVDGQRAVVRSVEIVGQIEPRTLTTASRLLHYRPKELVDLVTTTLQIFILAGVLTGAAAGWWTWNSVLLVIALLSFGNAIITVAALLVRGAAPGAPTQHQLVRLLLLTPAEYILFRPAIALSRIKAIL
jgi:hypothetical protein